MSPANLFFNFSLHPYGMVVIFFGKSGAIDRICQTIDMARELALVETDLPAVRRGYGYTLCNGSLDFSRNLCTAPFGVLLHYAAELGERIGHSDESMTTTAYILRNYSIMLGETGKPGESLAIIEQLEKMHQKKPYHRAVAEELGRTLAGGVVTTLRYGDREASESCRARLQELAAHFPDSRKIDQALSNARKNCSPADCS